MSNDTPTPKKKIFAPRVEMPCQPGKIRAHNFKEVSLGYTPEMAMKEAARCLQCKRPSCMKGCPVEINIPAFIAEIAKGSFREAYRIIKMTNPLPAISGRVCPQENQCEGRCILKAKGQPVAIGRLERFAADQFRPGLETSPVKPLPENAPRVACIGSGPASLACAGHLADNGIAVDVFEALHEPGGVLIYGIPAFRLPKDVVHRELDALRRLGVNFKTNWVGGRTIQVEELLRQGYKAVFIGVGAGLPIFLDIPGENLIGVFSANEYLTRVNLGHADIFPRIDTPVYPGRQVTVYGAGNVAMDAARTAMRMGAESVRIVYRRTRAEMPARLEEVHHAEEEGIQFEELAAPIRFNGNEDEILTSVSLQRMRQGEPDASGRRRPEPVEGDIYDLPTDLAIIALGTRSNPILLDATPNLEKTPRGYIATNEETGETSIPDVFAGGDIVTGAATVILAMGAGRRAAIEIVRRINDSK